LHATAFAGAGFHVVLQGATRLTADGTDPVVLGIGDVAFLPHGTSHELSDATTGDRPAPPVELRLERADEPEQEPAANGTSTALLCGAYLLDQARPHPLLADLPTVIHLPARLGSHPRLRATIDLLGTEIAKPGLGGDIVVPALLDTLLLYILRASYSEQSEQSETTGWAAALTDPAVSATLLAIHRDPSHPWTVQTLGAIAGLSRAPFARRFTALVGQPPLTYLTWWRMTKAAELLHRSDAPMRTIAAEVGYTSEFAFARAFKREYGSAPGTYRRQQTDQTTLKAQPT
jgi:AraC-like DNA-binding protein